MFEYEIATARREALIREADAYRLAQEAKKAAKAEKARGVFSRSQNPERPVRGNRARFTRAA
ncbi:hypothetical protein ACFXDJ_12110 [Streptomyces sp. NPDC059443]|uniref:hypothetical protein n=1 Tax=unclassified Streptomyces TaxID=2593676 RepID=UPI00368BA425